MWKLSIKNSFKTLFYTMSLFVGALMRFVHISSLRFGKDNTIYVSFQKYQMISPFHNALKKSVT